MAFNQERRKKALLEMKNELVDLASEDITFSDAAPDLFSKGFVSTAKQKADELKCLKQVQHQKRSFLGGRRPQDHRGSVPTKGTVPTKGASPSTEEVDMGTEAGRGCSLITDPQQEKKTPRNSLAGRIDFEETKDSVG